MMCQRDTEVICKVPICIFDLHTPRVADPCLRVSARRRVDDAGGF